MAFTVRSPVRWWLTGLCVVGVVLAGLVLVLALVLRAYAPTLSRDRLETALTEALGRPVRIEGVTLSAWRRRIEIRDLRVDPGPGEGAEPLLRLDRGEVRIGLSSLWRRQVVLSRILLQGVTLRTFGSGEGSSPPLVVPDTVQLGPVTVRIVTVQIERGRVIYRDETRGLTVDAQSLNVTARPFQGGIDASLSLAALAVETPHLREMLTEVEGSGWIRQDRLTLRQLAGRWQERPLRVTGDVRDPFAAAALALRVQGEVDLAPLAPHLDAAWPLAGIATVAVDVRGRSDAPEISGRVSVPRLTAAFIHARDVAARGKWSQAELALQLQGEVDLAPVGQALKSSWPLAGMAALAADVRGRSDAPEISGHLTVPRLTAGATQVRDLAVRVQWRLGVLDLPQITARIFEGTLRGSLKATLDRLEDTRATLVLQQASLASLDALAGAPVGLRGEVDVEAEVEGDPRRLEDTRGRFRVTATRVVPPGDLSRIGPGTLTAAGTLQNATAALTHSSARWNGLQIEASGRLGQEGPIGLRLVLHADLGHVAPLWGVQDVAGRATFQGEANGHWTAPEFTGEVRTAPLTLAGVKLDSLYASLQLRGTNLVVHSATAGLGQSLANASGTLTWSVPGDAAGTHALQRVQFRADIHAPTVQWDDARQWLPKNAQGTGAFALAGRVAGTPDAWRADGTIEARALTTHDVPLQDLQGTFSVTPDRVEVPRLRARVHGIPIRGTGTWRWEGAGQATAEAGPVDLAGIPGVPPTLDLRGTGRAHVQVAVRDGTVEGSGTAALDRVAVGDIALGNGSGQLAIREGQIHVTLALPERRLSATARGALDGDRPLSVRLDAREVELAPLVAKIEQLRELNVDGTLTAAAEFLVPPSQPSGARGALTLDAVRLLVAGEEWTNREPIALRWEPSVLTVDRLRLASRLGDLTVSGRVDPWAAITLQVDGRFPLGILPAFRPEIREAAGTLKIVAQIGGTTAAPQPVGEATIQGGTFQLRDRPETLREVEARVLLSPAGLRLVEANASLGRGRIRASGDLTLRGWRPDAYRIIVAGKNVSIEPLQGLQSAWDLDLEFVGQGPRVLLRGEGRLLQGRYTGKLNLVTMLLARRSDPPADEAPGIPLHVLLKLNDNLRIDTNWARMQAGGTLNLEGTTTQPVLLGSLESREGRITFRKHRWTVTSAAIRFADPRRIDPILDVTGRALIKEYDVSLRLSGRLDELTFRFSSIPALTQDQVLTLVTMGTTKLAGGNAAGGAVAGEVAQLFAEDVLGLATGGYAPETLELETTDKKERVVNVGKQVTEDVRVLYSQTLSGASKRVVRVEYQIIGPLLLSAEQDFQGGFGGDLLIRLRFR